MKFRRQRLDDVSVNLTPLIDVVFLLLIFFMVSTTFTRETQLSVDLPEAQGQLKENNEELYETYRTLLNSTCGWIKKNYNKRKCRSYKSFKELYLSIKNNAS